jgi:hypothetical protein
MKQPPTGELYAGEPLVQFGGRGGRTGPSRPLSVQIFLVADHALPASRTFDRIRVIRAAVGTEDALRRPRHRLPREALDVHRRLRRWRARRVCISAAIPPRRPEHERAAEGMMVMRVAMTRPRLPGASRTASAMRPCRVRQSNREHSDRNQRDAPRHTDNSSQTKSGQSPISGDAALKEIGL